MDEMLKRKPLMKRKPDLTVVIGMGKPKEDAPPMMKRTPVAGPSAADAETVEGSELVQCPNCDAVFNANKHPASEEAAADYESESGAETQASDEEQD